MRSRVLRMAATMLAVASFGLAGMRPAAADAPLQKVTIALAGKALAAGAWSLEVADIRAFAADPRVAVIITDHAERALAIVAAAT